MHTPLTSDQWALLIEIVDKELPAVLPKLRAVGIEGLSFDERAEIVEHFAMEYSATGVGADWEPNERGRAIDYLLDFVNRYNLGPAPAPSEILSPKTNPQIARAEEAFFDECRKRPTSLADLVALVRGTIGEDSPSVKTVCLALVWKSLAEGRLHAGDMKRGKFVKWTSTPIEAHGKIGLEWSRLEHNPNDGEIVWFIST